MNIDDTNPGDSNRDLNEAYKGVIRAAKEGTGKDEQVFEQLEDLEAEVEQLAKVTVEERKRGLHALDRLEETIKHNNENYDQYKDKIDEIRNVLEDDSAEDTSYNPLNRRDAIKLTGGGILSVFALERIVDLLTDTEETVVDPDPEPKESTYSFRNRFGYDDFADNCLDENLLNQLDDIAEYEGVDSTDYEFEVTDRVRTDSEGTSLYDVNAYLDRGSETDTWTLTEVPLDCEVDR